MVVLVPIDFHYMDKDSWNILQNIFFVFYRRQTAYKFGMTRGWISPAEKTIETFTELVIVTVHTTGRNEEHADEDKLQINSL